MDSSDIASAVARLYDTDPGREWARMDRHRTEFAVTLRVLREYLPRPPAAVLDCGGGPGRYAIELAQQGYAVTLFDLATGNLTLARQRAAEAGAELARYEQGTATDLSRFPAGSFDAVLLMGPLYHLLEERERRQALAEAYRVLARGGVLLAAFITRYAAHRDCAARYPAQLLAERRIYDRILADGCLPPPADGRVGFVAYFAHPTEAAPLCWQVGFEVAAVLGVEGVASAAEEELNKLDGPAWDAWAEVNRQIAADPCIHGGAEHLLAVAVKPRWRMVLSALARQLDAAGVHYKIVGGASLALHGLPLAVRDVDIETDAPGAYRFQQLFPAQVVEPVALRCGDAYRSHLGHFVFDGIPVEVMGGLERREGDAWLPTWATTETMVKLEDVPVRVSWLEEETLAYVRRGRLERAAFCLPRCDHDRLMALLRREITTQVV